MLKTLPPSLIAEYRKDFKDNVPIKLNAEVKIIASCFPLLKESLQSFNTVFSEKTF